MFKKRSHVRKLAQKWDDERTEKIRSLDRLEVIITSMERTMTNGSAPHGPLAGSVSASGLMSYPDYIPVEFGFGEQDIGGSVFFYNVQTKPTLPFIEAHLSNDEFELMWKGHTAALLSGAKASHVRLWKVQGEGAMTAKDQSEGYSYESRYKITGITTWEGLCARSLPNWALPMSYRDFSLADLPESYSIDDILR